MYTAAEATSEMIGKTSGDVLGLGHAFQSAQDAANGMAKELVGAYITGASAHLTDLAASGTKVYQAFARMTAEADLALKGPLGGTLTDLLQKGSTYAIQFGQTLGNLGEGFLRLAGSLPGTAELILRVIDGLSKAFLWVSKLPSGLLSLVLAFEAAYRVGGRFVRLLGRIPLGLAKLLPASSAAAVGLTNLGTSMRALSGPVLGIAAGVVALGIWLAKAKSPADDLAASIDQMVQAASNVAALQTLANGLSQIGHAQTLLSVQMSHGNQALNEAFAGFTAVSGVTGGLASGLSSISIRAQGLTGWLSKTGTGLEHTNTGFAAAAGAVLGFLGSFGHASAAAEQMQSLSAEQQKLYAQTKTLIAGGAAVSHQFGVSFVTALGLADAAGVKLTDTIPKFGKALNAAGQQIENTILGYEKMGQSGTILASDMNAITIQAGIQNSQVSKLNQAWDYFLGLITGGTTGLASFEQSLTNLTTGTNTVTTILGKTKSVTLSVKEFASSLKSFSGQGAQAWQNLGQVIGQTGPQLIDWLRTASSTGAITRSQFVAAVKDMTAQMIPLVEGSKTATAQLSAWAQMAGGKYTDSAKSLAQWAGKSGNAQKQLAGIIADASKKMSNASVIAQQFAGTLKNQVSDALAAATVGALHLDKMVGTMADDIHSGATKAAEAVGQQLYDALRRAGFGADAAAGMVEASMHASGLSIAAATREGERFKKVWDSYHNKQIRLNVAITTTGSVPSAYYQGSGGGHAVGPGRGVRGHRDPRLRARRR